MKYIWNGINTALVFLVFVCVSISRDINTQAYDACKELEKEVEWVKEDVNALKSHSDTIVVNIKTYNYYRNENK